MKKLILLILAGPLLMGGGCINKQINKTSLDSLPAPLLEAINAQKKEVGNNEDYKNAMQLFKCKKDKQIFYNFRYSYGYGDSESNYFDETGKKLGREINTDTGQTYMLGDNPPDTENAKCESIPLF